MEAAKQTAAQEAAAEADRALVADVPGVEASWAELARFFAAVRKTIKNGRFEEGSMQPVKKAAIEQRAPQWRVAHVQNSNVLKNFMGELRTAAAN